MLRGRLIGYPLCRIRVIGYGGTPMQQVVTMVTVGCNNYRLANRGKLRWR